MYCNNFRIEDDCCGDSEVIVSSGGGGNSAEWVYSNPYGDPPTNGNFKSTSATYIRCIGYKN